MSLLRRGATLAPDPDETRHRSADPGDNYLLALAEAERAMFVSGDRYLLELGDELPIESARAFLDSLAEASP